MTTIHTKPNNAKLPTGELSYLGNGHLLCTTEDFDQFVVTEADAVKACFKAEIDKQNMRALQDAFELTMRRIADWCRRHPIVWCAMAPRSEDMIVVMCANDEDESGVLHDAMADLDVELFQRTAFALSFLLFRNSEAQGVTAFMDAARARIIYFAERERTQGSLK